MTPEELEIALNKVPPMEVWRALDGIHHHPLRGPHTAIDAVTGDAELQSVGVVVRAAGDNVVFRVTAPAPLGMRQRDRQAFYDQLTLPVQGFEGFAAAMLDKLRAYRPLN